MVAEKIKKIGDVIKMTSKEIARRKRNLDRFKWKKKKKSSTISRYKIDEKKGGHDTWLKEHDDFLKDQIKRKKEIEATALKKIKALEKKILQKLDAKNIERFLRIKNGAGSNVGKFNQLKTFERKVKNMNVGGLTSSAMQNGLSRKINPSTGLTMNKGGMTDYRKSGMFYGGGMARRGR